MCLIRTEERGRTGSLDLLTTLLLHPRKPWAFSATRHVTGSQRTFMSFSAKLLYSQEAPSMYWCLGLFRPCCRTLHFPFLNFMKFLSAHFSILLRSLWMAAWPFGLSVAPLSLVWSANLMKVVLYPTIQIINEVVNENVLSSLLSLPPSIFPLFSPSFLLALLCFQQQEMM